MNLKKHNWIKYGRISPDTTAKLIIEKDGKKIDFAKWDLKDKYSERNIFTIFKHKYGLFKQPKEKLEQD